MRTTTVINGTTFITDDEMLEHGNTVRVKRSWFERLFDTPWKPLKRFKLVTPLVPLSRVYKLPGGAFLGHPEAIKAIKDAIADPLR